MLPQKSNFGKMKLKILSSLLFLSVNCVQFTPPEQIENEDNFVTVGLTLIDKRGDRFLKLGKSLLSLIDSILLHSEETNIHFVIITDEPSFKGNIQFAF